MIALALLLLGADRTLLLEGEVKDDAPEVFLLPFEVPAGVAEIEVRHDDLSDRNILDWGVRDPERFRGWGGGNTEPAVIGVSAASRSYYPGALPAGTWNVMVGKALIKDRPARYRIEVVLRDAPVLAPQTERRPYADVVRKSGARWYAGDFHVHSRESGDARPTLDEIAEVARMRGLDFVELSDHNTTSQLELIADVSQRHPDLLFIPGSEITTYHGHANGIGITRPVDWTGDFASEVAAQGALLAVNHPALDIGDLCIGCGWKQEVPPEKIGAVEIGTGGWRQAGFAFGELAIELWDGLCAKGAHAAAIGGSDAHRTKDLQANQSPIGDPTTMVFAAELSRQGILDAVRAGRTVVKLQGPDDPMIEIRASEPREGDTITAERVQLSAEVTRGTGARVRWIKNGQQLATAEVTADPFVLEMPATAPAAGAPDDRWRAEVLIDDKPRTVTSHLWIRRPPAKPAEPEGCRCGTAGATRGGSVWIAAFLLLIVRYTRPRWRR